MRVGTARGTTAAAAAAAAARYDEECCRKWKLQGVIPTHVPDGPNKLYITGVPKHWREDELLKVLQQAGEVGGFTLVREKDTSESKGYVACLRSVAWRGVALLRAFALMRSR